MYATPAQFSGFLSVAELASCPGSLSCATFDLGMRLLLTPQNYGAPFVSKLKFWKAFTKRAIFSKYRSSIGKRSCPST